MNTRLRRIAGLRTHGAESLAVAAGGLVFSGGLTAGHCGGAGGGIDANATMVRDGLARVLQALSSDPGRVAKVKSVLADMRETEEAGRLTRSAWPAAAAATVGAQLRRPEDRLAVEVVAGIDDGPQGFGPPGRRPPATRLGSLVFTAGCGPATEGPLVGAGDLAAQAHAALGAVCDALDLAGAAPSGLLKINNTAACWHDYRLYNAAYNAVLSGSNAARCSVGGSLDDPLALIEVEAVASLRPDLRFVDSTRSGVGRTAFVARSDTVYRPDLGPCKGPHSHGARAGDLVFVAGECPYDADDRLVGPGDIAAQTLRTLDNVRLSLAALGAGLDDVVKTSVTLSDARLFAGFETAYRQVFAAPYPARSVVAAPLGQYGILVEIEAIAVVGAAATRVAAVGADEVA